MDEKFICRFVALAYLLHLRPEDGPKVSQNTANFLRSTLKPDEFERATGQNRNLECIRMIRAHIFSCLEAIAARGGEITGHVEKGNIESLEAIEMDIILMLMHRVVPVLRLSEKYESVWATLDQKSRALPQDQKALFIGDDWRENAAMENWLTLLPLIGELHKRITLYGMSLTSAGDPPSWIELLKPSNN